MDYGLQTKAWHLRAKSEYRILPANEAYSRWLEFDYIAARRNGAWNVQHNSRNEQALHRAATYLTKLRIEPLDNNYQHHLCLLDTLVSKALYFKPRWRKNVSRLSQSHHSLFTLCHSPLTRTCERSTYFGVPIIILCYSSFNFFHPHPASPENRIPSTTSALTSNAFQHPVPLSSSTLSLLHRRPYLPSPTLALRRTTQRCLPILSFPKCCSLFMLCCQPRWITQSRIGQPLHRRFRHPSHTIL